MFSKLLYIYIIWQPVTECILFLVIGNGQQLHVTSALDEVHLSSYHLILHKYKIPPLHAHAMTCSLPFVFYKNFPWINAGKFLINFAQKTICRP